MKCSLILGVSRTLGRRLCSFKGPAALDSGVLSAIFDLRHFGVARQAIGAEFIAAAGVLNGGLVNNFLALRQVGEAGVCSGGTVRANPVTSRSGGGNISTRGALRLHRTRNVRDVLGNSRADCGAGVCGLSFLVLDTSIIGFDASRRLRANGAMHQDANIAGGGSHVQAKLLE